jgi:hypothetical protein
MGIDATMHLGNGYTIETAREFNEVLALRDDWQRMALLSVDRRQRHGIRLDPAVDLDFYLTGIRSGNETLSPHVVVLRRDGVAKTILVGRIDRTRLQVSLGYKRVSSNPARLLVLTHGGMLGEDSEEYATLLVESVKKCLRDREADVAWFYGMEPDSAFCRVAKDAGGWITRDYCPELTRRWRVRLPASYEDLLKQVSTNTRHNLKRYSKRLRDAFGDQLTVKNFRNPGDVETILSDTEVIAAKTYQRGLGVGFADTDGMHQHMNLAANRGWLRAHILYIGSKPAAYWNGILYQRTLFTWTTGYDPDLSHLRPGTFLLQKMLQELCNEKAADEVDFGFGDAQYKRDWCDDEHFQVSQFLFAPTARGLFLSIFHSSLSSASTIARKLLTQTGAVGKIKKAWRARAAQRTAPNH